MLSSKLFSEISPAVPLRGVHLDLKGFVPSFPRLLELLRLFSHLRFDMVLVEWEDCFPWSCDPRLCAPHGFSRKQILKFSEVCTELGLEIVPLVQSLGHSENVLRLPGNEGLREMPHRTDVFHPLAKGAPEVVAAMVADVLELLPKVRYFHLGGDEAYTLGLNPASQSYIEKNGIAALYLRQLEASFRLLEEKGIRPMLWHDEVAQWDPDQVRCLTERVDFVVWGYTGDPRDEKTYHHRLPQIKKLYALGATLWGATAYKGADGPSASLPDTLARANATVGWAALTPNFDLKGVWATGWSRYASGRIQVAPIDGALDSLAYTALVFHNGRPPENGLSDCLALLDEAGEGEAFRECQATLRRFSELLDRSWDWIRQLEEQAVNLELEPHRADSGIEEIIFNLLDKDLQQVEVVGQELECFLESKVAAPLPEYFWQSRFRAVTQAANQVRERIAFQAQETLNVL